VTSRPYSRTRVAGGMLFVAGLLGRRGDGIVDGGPAAELEQALANLDGVLGDHGLDAAAVVRLVVYTTDLSTAPALDDVFAGHFGEPRPVRTTVGVAALPAGATVEIEATCDAADAPR
jgi:2-iminobutanoate/2-iminopropanoate deaminase